MIILVPLGGIGKRFSDLGYTDPKPLIKVKGKELIFWLLDSLKTKKNDRVYLIYNNLLENYKFEEKILSKHKNVSFLKLPINTKGPIQTINEFIKISNFRDQKEKVVIIDGDVFFNIDILSKIRKQILSSLFYFKTKETKPIYSYIKLRKKDVIEIAEKIKISSNANCGVYFFSSLEILKKNINLSLKKSKKNLYISDVFKLLLKNKNRVNSILLNKNDFSILGTPDQIKEFSLKNDIKTQTFFINFNSLYNEYNVSKNFYENFIPNISNHKFINNLYLNNHKIYIVYVLQEFNFNKNSNSKLKTELIIKKILKNSNLNYTKLIHQQYKYDHYIDSKAVNSINNLNTKLGFYDNTVSRDFNSITVGENYTIKKSLNKRKLKSEINYYQNLNQNIKHLFPDLIESGSNYYKIKTINGVSYSYLYNNNLLNEKDLVQLINSIDIIHSSTAQYMKQKKIIKKNTSNLNIYSNYAKKLRDRIKNIDKNLINEENFFIHSLILKLEDYKKNSEGIFSVIHGDPTFSNIFRENNRSIKFIDPRGALDNQLTIFGDKFYDYAKIYQSLTGFESILNYKKINNEYNNSNRVYFESFFSNRFGKEKLDILKILTASLYITLIPLQPPRLKYKFFKIAKNLQNGK